MRRRPRYLLHAYAQFLQRRNELAAAEVAMSDALAFAEAAMGTEHAEAHRLRAGLAAILVDDGRADEAEALARPAHAALIRELSADHPDALVAATSLGRALTALRRVGEAASLLGGAHERARSTLGEGHPLSVGLERALAEANEWRRPD